MFVLPRNNPWPGFYIVTYPTTHSSFMTWQCFRILPCPACQSSMVPLLCIIFHSFGAMWRNGNAQCTNDIICSNRYSLNGWLAVTRVAEFGDLPSRFFASDATPRRLIAASGLLRLVLLYDCLWSNCGELRWSVCCSRCLSLGVNSYTTSHQALSTVIGHSRISHV